AREIGTLARLGRLGEGAVMAHVAAELRQGDEDLPRVADDVRVCAIAQFGRDFEQGVEVGFGGKSKRVRMGRELAVAGSRENRSGAREHEGTCFPPASMGRTLMDSDCEV